MTLKRTPKRRPSDAQATPRQRPSNAQAQAQPEFLIRMDVIRTSPDGKVSRTFLWLAAPPP